MGNCLTECCDRDQSYRSISPMQGKRTSSMATTPHLSILIQVEANNLPKRKPSDHSNYGDNWIHPYLVVKSYQYEDILYQSQGLYITKGIKNDIKWTFKIDLSDYNRKENTLDFHIYHESLRGPWKDFLIGSALDVKLMKDFPHFLWQRSSSDIIRQNGTITIKYMDYFVNPPFNMPIAGLGHPTTFVMKFKAKLTFLPDPKYYPLVLKVFGPWKKSSGEWNIENWHELAVTEMETSADADWDMVRINLPRDYDGSFQREFRKENLMLKVYYVNRFNKILVPFAYHLPRIEDLFFRKENIKEFPLLRIGEADTLVLGPPMRKGILILEEFGLVMPIDSRVK